MSLYPPYTHEEIKERKTRLNAVREYFNGKTDLKRGYSGQRICKIYVQNIGLCGKCVLMRAVKPTAVEEGGHDSGCDIVVSTSEAKFLVRVVPARQPLCSLAGRYNNPI